MSNDKKVRRGRPPKTKDFRVGDFEVREVEGKYLIYLHGNVRAIRHTEQAAREYIAMVS